MNKDVKYPTVMLIDDNELDNFVNKKIIENQSFCNKTIVMTSAGDALDYLKSKAASDADLPELIFLDIMMPVMDGFGFLDAFENLPESVRNKCKVVMLSTSESFKDLNRANKCRFVHKFLNKPLNEAVLAAINV